MSRPFAALSRQLCRLVHPAVADPTDAVRHAWFIGSRLACGAVGLASLPLLLGLRGQMDLVATLTVIALVLQAFTALLVSRTGELLRGQVFSIFVAAVAIPGIALAGDGLLSPALVGLPVLVIEAGMLGRTSCLRLTILLAMAAVLATALASPGLSQVAALISVHLSFIAGAAALAAITVRELATRRLQEKRLVAQNAVLMEGFGELLTRHDAQGNVMYAGSAADTLLGCRPHELLGRALLERVHVADRPLFLMTIADAAASPDVVRAAVRMRRGNLDLQNAPVFSWIEVKARQFLDAEESGDVREIVCLLRDVSDQKRYESEIEAARSNAESASAMKDRFLATVSHELRTPLNAIIGFSEMLADQNLVPIDDARRREYAQIIKLSGEHLLGVVNTLLDLSRIDGGTFAIEPEPIEIKPFVDSTLDLLRLKAEAGQVTLTCRIEPGLPALVADRRACRQILLNLLSNAVKFTPAGGHVGVDIRREGETLVIRVQDTGIGIAAADLPRIGEPFFQVRGTYDRPYEGTGLGFSVVRGLVALHAGTLTLDSEPGSGTSVTVRLGLDTRIPQSPPPASLEPRRRHAPAGEPTLSVSAEPVKKRA